MKAFVKRSPDRPVQYSNGIHVWIFFSLSNVILFSFLAAAVEPFFVMCGSMGNSGCRRGILDLLGTVPRPAANGDTRERVTHSVRRTGVHRLDSHFGNHLLRQCDHQSHPLQHHVPEVPAGVQRHAGKMLRPAATWDPIRRPHLLSAKEPSVSLTLCGGRALTLSLCSPASPVRGKVEPKLCTVSARTFLCQEKAERQVSQFTRTRGF